jgi:hypothetical protein
MGGLLRGVARTAVVAGTATAVSNRVSRRQAGRWAAQEQAAQLEELGQLRDEGLLDDAEFELQKSRILSA